MASTLNSFYETTLFRLPSFGGPLLQRTGKTTLAKLYGEIGGGVATSNGTVSEGGVRVDLSNNRTWAYREPPSV